MEITNNKNKAIFLTLLLKVLLKMMMFKKIK